MSERKSGREPNEIRKVRIERDFTRNPLGSVLLEAGNTVVLSTVCMEDGVPPFLLNTNRGWLTAEYSMLPGSTGSRKVREGRRGGHADARSLEIGRLIGRSLRAACDLTRFPGRTVWVDCDVLQADGGTRTWAISGAMVALSDAFKRAEERGWLRSWPVRSPVAALSVGILNGEILADLDYKEDSRAEVDMNVVMTGEGHYIEVQGAAERKAFRHDQLLGLLEVAGNGIRQIFDHQERALHEES